MKRGTLRSEDMSSRHTTLNIDSFSSKESETQYDITNVLLEVPTHESIFMDVTVVDTLEKRINMNRVSELAQRG